MFLFTTASSPGMLLAPHLLLDALLATVAKIVLSPSASAPSPPPRAWFCEPIPLPSCLCLLLRDCCGVQCRTWTDPERVGLGCGSASFGERAGRGLCRWPWPLPHCLVGLRWLSGFPRGGRLLRPSEPAWQAPLLLIPKYNSSWADSLLQSWPDCLTS